MISTFTETKIFTKKNYWEAAQAMAFPTAIWRLPKQREKHLLIDFSEKPLKTKIDFEELGAGFAFSPFINPDGNESLFLKADLHFVENTENHSGELIYSSNHSQMLDFQVIIESGNYKKTIQNQNSEIKQHNKDEFLELVQKGIEAIEAGLFQKVVLSRTKQITLRSDFDVVALFDKLCEVYPTAFVSVVSLPHLGVVWVGASPEILVSQDANGIFRTMALAGTQSAFDADNQPIKPSEAMWRQKEIEEQALVSRYIINCFKKIRVREFEEEGPKTVVAGNLMHLRTDFIVDTVDVNFPQLATVMLDLLHPTSAVCGMPKVPATDFILENEGYDRQFYSGFLGPINIQQSSHIFVNLRTMKIEGESATLYAGCGITADSNPEKEWKETEMKCQTLGNIIS
jgi:isochorismate synthase